jgi:hypothetical protein
LLVNRTHKPQSRFTRDDYDDHHVESEREIIRKNDKPAEAVIRASTVIRSKPKWIAKDLSKILMDLTMNQFPEKNSQALSEENAKSPQAIDSPLVLPNSDTIYESGKSSAEQIESNIERLIAEASNSAARPATDTHNFDVQDYARLSMKPPTNVDQAVPNPADVRVGLQFGESDPYVDPAELAENDCHNRKALDSQRTEDELDTSAVSADEFNVQADSANQTLEQIGDFQQQLELLESEASQRQPMPVNPKVEIIGTKANEMEAVENVQESPVGQPVEVPGDEVTSIAWFAELSASDTANSLATPAPQTSIPIVDQETGETMFDVRDFSDAADGVIEPIPGAFEFEPDLFDFKTIDEIEKSEDSKQVVPAAPQDNADSGSRPDPHTENQILVAGTGDVIQVNGSDGFDHIDLACFDVKWATFSEQVIQVNDQQGSSFEIHYQDIAYALFADGIEVRLGNDEVR